MKRERYQELTIKTAIIIIAFCMLPGIAIASSNLMILNSKDIPEMRDCIARLEAKGARITHVFPPCVVIGDFSSVLPISSISAVSSIYPVSASLHEEDNHRQGCLCYYQGRVPDDVIQSVPRTSSIGIRIWNAQFDSFVPSVPPPKAPILSTEELPPPSNDCRILKKQQPLTAAPYLKAPPYGGAFYDTSVYMAGKIAVGIILPESNGNIENWTMDEVNNVISEIQAAMNWWADIEPASQLSFYYDIHTPFDGTQSVKIATEPITASNEGTWIKQVMNAIGYKDPGQGIVMDYFYYVFDYNNDIRDMLGTHWAFTIFVADSSNDKDGCFPDKGFAFAYLGGPFMVMTYDNQNYGIDNMDSVCAHETGHIFYALDEYLGASSKTERSGYLNVINSNHASNPASVPCIMKGLTSPFANHQVCCHTRGQVGLWDTDNDNIIDVLDSLPQVSLTPYSPDPTSNQLPTYTGHAMVTAVPNKNPQETPPLHDITINTISHVEYQIINNDAWSSATALDGVFDEPEEDFTFTVPTALPDGTYTFRVRAVDSAGNISNYAIDTLTIETYNHAPAPFSLIFPIDAAVIGVLKPEFDWEDTIDIDTNDVVSYTLWYAKDADFASKTEVTGLSSSRYIPSVDLDSNSTYYWKVYAVDKNGNKTWSRQIWSFSTQKITIIVEATLSCFANEIPTTPVVGDLNGDGHPEIVFGGINIYGFATSSHLYVFKKHADNQVEEVWIKSTDGNCLGVSLGDLNNDGLPEIAVYTYNQVQNSGTLSAINPDATIRWATRIPNNRTQLHTDALYQRDPSLGDVNGDGCCDVVINACDGSLWVISGKDGKELWHKEFSGNLTGYCGKTAVVDLDNDGKSEVIIASTNHFGVYRNDGSLWWQTEGCDFAIADLDGDKKPEIVVIGYVGLVQAYRYDGKIFWSCPYSLDAAGPGIADIDGDGKPEIVLPVENKYICALNGEDGSLLWKTEDLNMGGKWKNGDMVITDLDNDGLMEIVGMSQKKAIVLIDARGGKVIAKLDINIDFASMSPIVADVDNDGHAEILVPSGESSDATYRGKLIVLGDDACWKNCRKVWNQVSYYMTNIDAELLPTTDLCPWLTHNTWRAQLPEFTDGNRGVVMGMITDTQGLPVSGARVQASLNTSANGTAVSKPDGSYKIILLVPASHTVSVSADGFFPATKTDVLIVLGSITNHVDFQLEKMPDEAFSVSVLPGTYSLSIFETHLLTAEVTDKNGKKVCDGTQVIWQTDNGMVSPAISYTINGIAASTYIAPAMSGMATVTAIASSTSMPQATSQITINVGTLYRLELLPRQATVRAGETCSFTAQAYDRSWQKIPEIEYRWNLSAGMGTLFQVTGTSNTFTAAGQLGTETIVVSCPAASLTEGMTATAMINIIPGELHHIVIIPGTSSVEVGSSVELTASGYDQYNNPIPSLEYNWQIDSQHGSLSTVAGSSTRFIAGTVPGTTTIIASLGTITGYAKITIIPGRLHHIVIEPNIVRVQAQTQQVFFARGYDQYNNHLSGILFDWTVDNGLGDISSLSGTKTILTAGKFIMDGRITASSNDVSGYATVTITPGELGYFCFEHISNQQAGKEFAITITAMDKGGNIINNYNGQVILSDAINTLANFMAGTWTGTVNITMATCGTTIRAEEQDGKTGISNPFDVLPAKVSWIEIIPNYQEVMVCQTTTITAIAYDQYNNHIAEALFSWMIVPSASGSMDAGIFTAGTRTGTLSLIALSNGERATATIRIISRVVDHFEFGHIPHQIAGNGFPISITAHDRYHNLVDTFVDSVKLSDSTGSIMPQHTGVFINGLWNGTITINNLMLGLNITATSPGLSGTSNQFSALIDDDIGVSTTGSITVTFDAGAMKGTDYYPLITPDASSIHIEMADIKLHQYPWIKQMMSIGVSLVDGDKKPLAAGFDAPATMSVFCQDSLDAKKSIRLYQLDNDEWRYIPIQHRFDPINQRVWFAIPAPGTYTLTIHEAQPNLEALSVYPVPFKQASGDTHIIFKGLTEDSLILIYDLAGDLIRQQEHADTEWRWAVVDENISSGVYFFVVIDDEYRKKVGKIVIIK
ncbi:MAG: FG-GAP-like repeat-containing protein [bacterium]|nr:FG-GAP-like repeat-containing protein [bacterium]